jgi:trehalose/maltose hydrolase-like predicted phosphorylase
MAVPISKEGILEQFQGYFELKELDWEHYKSTYQDIHRLDRILKAEGLSPNSYKVAKQADALMLFYNLSEKTISTLLDQLGYDHPGTILDANLHYYLQRTSHGSTLSRLVHAYLAHIAGHHDLSWKLYQESLRSDYIDIQSGTTREGIHLGVMTGTVLFLLRAYAGLDWTDEYINLNPALPPGWKRMEFNLSFRGLRYYFDISPQQVKVKIDSDNENTISINNKNMSLKSHNWLSIDI